VHGSAAHEGRSFTCPGAAVTTAATPSYAFPVAAAEICKEHTAECAAQEHQFALPSRAFACSECGQRRDSAAENTPLLSWAVNEWVVCSHPDRGATLLSNQEMSRRALRIG
jgi:hypothetical protein